MSRLVWTSLNDAQLLSQCEVDTYRASGPGGQKRNKTSSAVRLRHTPSGILVIAEESRSQHQNKAKALRRLRERFWMQLRETQPEESVSSVNLHIGKKDERYWPTWGLVLDVLDQCKAQVSTAAKYLGTTTGNLIDFLETHDAGWTEANRLRQRFGLSPLRQG